MLIFLDRFKKYFLLWNMIESKWFSYLNMNYMEIREYLLNREWCLYIWLGHKSVSFAFGLALGWRLFLHNFFNPNPFIYQLQQKFVQSVYHPITNKLSSHDFHFLKDWNYTVIIKGELTKDFGIILEVLHK